MIATILYLLGLSMTFCGFEETDEEDDRGMSFFLSLLWPIMAAGMLIYMVHKTLKK